MRSFAYAQDDSKLGHVLRPARRRLVQPVAGVRRRRPVQRRPAAGGCSRACRPRPRRPRGLRQGLWGGRDARSRPGRQREPAQAPHRRRQGQSHRFRRVPSRLSRPDGKKHRPRHPRLGARRQRQAGAGVDAGGAALSRDRGRERPYVPHHHDACLRRRLARRAGAARQMAAQDPDAHLRSAPAAVVGEERRHPGHGHDRAPGRHRRARQHHPGRAGGRSCRDHRPQMVHVGADVRCLFSARPSAGMG